MTSVDSITVAPADKGVRLDRWFRRRYPGVGHGLLQKWLRTGQVRVDGKRAKAGHHLQPGEVVRIPPMRGDQSAPRPQRSPPADGPDLVERIIHMDPRVLAIDKPPGLAVQGGTSVRHHVDAMLDGLRFDGVDRPRLVHRLDKDTSGVLLLARDAAAAAALSKAFRDKSARKVYWALVAGVPEPRRGRIDLALAKRAVRQGERVVGAPRDGRRAVTAYQVVATAGRQAAWVVLAPETGRTHQLRAHCASLGTPIVGDGKYGGKAAFPGGDGIARRLHLHARSIHAPHPDGGSFEVTAPLPGHMVESWQFLGFNANDANAIIFPDTKT